MAANKQPIFAGSPILNVITFTPPVVEDNPKTINGSWAYTPVTVFDATDAIGSIIDRITITSTGDTGPNNSVVEKLIYIYLFQGPPTSKYSLYKTLHMPATTISDSTPNPEIELTFTGGLVMNQTDQILIGVSRWSSEADRLSVTIEGGKLSQ